MTGQESTDLVLWVLVYAVPAVVAAFVPWWLYRGTRWAKLCLGIGAALSLTVLTAALMFPWSSGDAWVGIYAMLALLGACALAGGVGALGALIALVEGISSKQRAATFRAAGALVFILVLAFAVGAGPVLYEKQRKERFEARIAEMALKSPPPGASLEEIESSLTRAGNEDIEREMTEDVPSYTAFNLELVRLWHPATKLVHFATMPSEWDSRMLEDDALLMRAADEEASNFFLMGYISDIQLGDSTLQVIERWREARERAEPWGFSYRNGYRVVGPQDTTQLFEDHKFRRIVFKVSKGAAADAESHLVYHVYLTSPDGEGWYVVGLRPFYRRP